MRKCRSWSLDLSEEYSKRQLRCSKEKSVDRQLRIRNTNSVEAAEILLNSRLECEGKPGGEDLRRSRGSKQTKGKSDPAWFKAEVCRPEPRKSAVILWFGFLQSKNIPII